MPSRTSPGEPLFTAPFIRAYQSSRWTCCACNSRNRLHLPSQLNSIAPLHRLVCRTCKRGACLSCSFSSSVIRIHHLAADPRPFWQTPTDFSTTECVGWACCACGLSHAIKHSNGEIDPRTPIPVKMGRDGRRCLCRHRACRHCLLFSVEHREAYTPSPEAGSRVGGISGPSYPRREDVSGRMHPLAPAGAVEIDRARKTYNVARWLQEREAVEEQARLKVIGLARAAEEKKRKEVPSRFGPPPAPRPLAPLGRSQSVRAPAPRYTLEKSRGGRVEPVTTDNMEDEPRSWLRDEDVPRVQTEAMRDIERLLNPRGSGIAPVLPRSSSLRQTAPSSSGGSGFEGEKWRTLKRSTRRI